MPKKFKVLPTTEGQPERRVEVEETIPAKKVKRTVSVGDMEAQLRQLNALVSETESRLGEMKAARDALQAEVDEVNAEFAKVQPAPVAAPAASTAK